MERLCESKDEVSDFICRLIRIETVNPPGKNYFEVYEFLRGNAESLGLKCKTIVMGEEPYLRYILLAQYGSGSGTLYFHGHYDVTLPHHENQFHPKSDDERIWGKGTAGMKGGLASMLYAVKALQKLDLQLKGKNNINFRS